MDLGDDDAWNAAAAHITQNLTHAIWRNDYEIMKNYSLYSSHFNAFFLHSSHF